MLARPVSESGILALRYLHKWRSSLVSSDAGISVAPVISGANFVILQR